MTILLLAKTLTAAIAGLFMVWYLGLVVMLFIGSGDYGSWLAKASIILVCGAGALVVGLLLPPFVRDNKTFKELLSAGVMGMLGTLQLLALLLGLLINVTTGRGELATYATLGPLVIVCLALASVMVQYVRLSVRLVRDYLKPLTRPDPAPPRPVRH